MKTINTIEGKKRIIGEFDYFVKSEKCKHSNKDVCQECILFGTELIEVEFLMEEEKK